MLDGKSFSGLKPPVPGFLESEGSASAIAGRKIEHE